MIRIEPLVLKTSNLRDCIVKCSVKLTYSPLICLQAHPGTATYTVDEYEHLDSVVNMNTQVTNIMESMSKFMKAHPEGVHLICFSQGN